MLFAAEQLIVLASASPRRLALLRQIGVEPLVAAAEVEEYHQLEPGMSVADLVSANAGRKARAVAAAYPQALVIGADTVVCHQGQLLGKPADAAEAAAMLSRLSGETHQVYTGLCLIDNAGGHSAGAADMAEVRFHQLSATEIAAYVASGAPLDKAGAYGIQDAGGLFVAAVNGDPTTVVGLSLSLLRRLALLLRASR